MFGWLSQRQRLSAFLPWRFALDDQETIVTRTGEGGGLMKVVHLTPRDLETAGPYAKDIYHHQIAELQGRLGAGWTLWTDQWRWLRPHYLPQCDFGGCRAAQLVDEERRRLFADDAARIFDNSVFLTLMYNAEAADRIFEYLLGKERVSSTNALIDRYQAAIAEYLAELSRIYEGVTVLGGDALLSYLSQAVNYENWPVSEPLEQSVEGIAELLGTSTWECGLELKVGRNHVRTVELYNIGPLTSDTMELLHNIPFECRWVVRMESLARAEQSRRLKQLVGQFDQKRKNMMTNLVQHWTGRQQADTNLTAAQKAEDAKRLATEVEMVDTGYATLTVNVHTWHPDKERAEYQAAWIETELKGRGCRAEIATLNAVFAPLADIPGNYASERELQAIMPQITRLSPVTGLTRGAPTDNKWDYEVVGSDPPEIRKGPALLLCRSRRGLTVYFSFHSPGEDVGNTAIIGPTGSGKSALLSLMALESRKYRDCKVLVFDRGRSFMPACLCAGGDWIELGEGQAGVQPFRNIHDVGQFAIAHDWACKALRANGVDTDDKVKHALTSALRLLTRYAPEQRTITAAVELMGESRRARDGLATYRADGPYGSTFDSVVDSYGASSIVGIECDVIMKLDIAPLAILAIFNALRYERMRSGDPFVVFFDEAKAMLTHPAFGNEIDQMAREIRKANGVLVLASQSQAEFDDTQMTKVITDQMKNLIFLPDPNALRPQTAEFYHRIGLEDDHIRQIAEAHQKGEYFLVTPQYTRMVAIELVADDLAICGRTTPRDKMQAMQIRQECPPGDKFLEAWLAYTKQSTTTERAA